MILPAAMNFHILLGNPFLVESGLEQHFDRTYVMRHDARFNAVKIQFVKGMPDNKLNRFGHIAFPIVFLIQKGQANSFAGCI